jgi:hypothetical protein
MIACRPVARLLPHHHHVAQAHEGKRATSNLIDVLEERFPDTEFFSVKRKIWNGDVGRDLLLKLCVPEFATVLTHIEAEYYTLAAAAALIK